MKWYLNNNGYLVTTIYLNGKKKTICKHRYIYESYFKCKLKPNQIIHHKNKIKTDNHIKNLELITLSQHSTNHNRERSYKTYQNKTCTYCNNKPHARNLCRKHYAQWKRNGHCVVIERLHNYSKTCIVCNKKSHARGLCSSHYSQQQRSGKFNKTKQITSLISIRGLSIPTNLQTMLTSRWKNRK